MRAAVLRTVIDGNPLASGENGWKLRRNRAASGDAAAPRVAARIGDEGDRGAAGAEAHPLLAGDRTKGGDVDDQLVRSARTGEGDEDLPARSRQDQSRRPLRSSPLPSAARPGGGSEAARAAADAGEACAAAGDGQRRAAVGEAQPVRRPPALPLALKIGGDTDRAGALDRHLADRADAFVEAQLARGNGQPVSLGREQASRLES